MEQDYQFLDFLEAVKPGDAEVAQMFSTPKSRKLAWLQRPDVRKKLNATMEFIEAVREDRVSNRLLQEAFTTSDFNILTTNILQWKVAQAYVNTPQTFAPYTVIGKVPDFRVVRATQLDGLDQPLPAVPENGEYPEGTLAQRDYAYRVNKYGRGFGLSWETIVSDFLRLFDQMPGKLANAARNTEQQFVSKMYMAAGGPTSNFTDALGNSVNFFHAANANKGTGVLNVPNLEAAIIAMRKQVSPTNIPIMARPKYLEVPPDLEMMARRILSPGNLYATTVGRTDAAAPTATQNVNTNILAQYNLEIIVNEWLPLIGTTANGGSTFGQTSWFLWSDPGAGAAIELGYLAGHEQPELRQKLSNSMFLGGGIVPPDQGDFESDMLRWRVRHILGGTLLNPKFAYASDGSTA